MKILMRLILVAALVALGVWIWHVFYPSAEKIIRKRLFEVASCASFIANEGNITRLANAQKLGGYFTADAQAILDVPNVAQHTFEGRDEIVQAAFAAPRFASAMTIEFVDLDLALGPGKKTAQVELTAKINIPSDKDFVPQELKFQLKELDGHWLISRVETVRVLK